MYCLVVRIGIVRFYIYHLYQRYSSKAQICNFKNHLRVQKCIINKVWKWIIICRNNNNLSVYTILLPSRSSPGLRILVCGFPQTKLFSPGDVQLPFKTKNQQRVDSKSKIIILSSPNPILEIWRFCLINRK